MKSQHIEYRMIQRLRMLGYLLLIFCFGAIAYGLLSYFFIKEEEQIEEALQRELEEVPPISPWLVAVSFATVGAGCLWIVKDKRKKLLSKNDFKEDPSKEP